MGDTVDETEGLIREAIVLHLAAMRDDGQRIPEPSTLCDYVEVQP
jgi:predicted RNase H-like HicB family nuclease